MVNMKQNIVLDKSLQFAKDIIDLYKQMQVAKEYIISKQILRSGTSIGANINEATAGVSKRDFIAKMAIASKEARETAYWLKLIDYGEFVNIDLSRMENSCNELIRMLTSIVKTAQNNLK